jgi:hypothetical protein
VAGPFKVESKALTIASEAAPAGAAAKASNGKVEGPLGNPQTEVLAETEKDSSAGGNWISVSIVVFIAAAATGLATRKKKVKA